MKIPPQASRPDVERNAKRGMAVTMTLPGPDAEPAPRPVITPAAGLAAFEMIAARGVAGRLVFASPHSGTQRAADIGHRADIGEASLRSAEDALVDRLIGSGPDHGAPLICGRISRAYVDLNRDPGELDAGLIEGLEGQGEVSAKTAAGFGVIPRRSGDGQPLYDRRLTQAEAKARLNAVHAPYHAALPG